MLREFTVPIENGMRVKHGTKARFTLTTGRTVLEDEIMDVELVGAHITVTGITYNALTMSGGVSWWNPATGKPITKPKYKVRLRPEDVLTGDEMCDCRSCRR